MAHETTWTKDGCHVQVYGNVNAYEFKRVNEELCASPDFDHIKYFVRDLSGIQSCSFGEDEVQDVAYITAAASGYKKNLRGAFVIGDSPTEPLVQKFIHHMKNAGSHWNVRCFKHREPALKWATTDDHARSD